MSDTTLPPIDLWKRYKKYLVKVPSVGVSLDVSRMRFDDAWLKSMEPAMQSAFEDMRQLEAGAIANPDEGRRVGHYWLRDASLAPEPEIRDAITRDLEEVRAFARSVHQKQITPPNAPRFTDLLCIGIGGSALGPQLVADALGVKRDKLRVHFIDNTDPDGTRRVLESLGAKLKSTLVLVTSKSGGTPETRNGMLEAEAFFKSKDLDFANYAVAITGDESKLDRYAREHGWLKRFPMYDWVGGRTSVMATVGLVPAALQGIDIDKFLAGATKMDAATRNPTTRKNPAAMLALMWHVATHGRGEKDMVVLPYKDRLLLLSRYLQQLVMESLGKAEDLDGNVVEQGIAVYGNKGSTDQHAYVQQLRDGVNNFFATFVVCLADTPRPRKEGPLEVEDGVTSGDFLHGFWQGTRKALYENGRDSITLTINKIDAQTLGALIALYERAVGFYASLVNINAYHQPGVEAGKKAAASVLEVQEAVLAQLIESPQTAEQLAEAAGRPEAVETAHHILEHLAANKRIRKTGSKYTTLPT
jgi:glucose-6-phosphate isomerase